VEPEGSLPCSQKPETGPYPTWEAISHSASEEIPHFLWYQEGSLPCSKQPDTRPYPSWEADSSSASEEIPRLLWNLKVHYQVHESPKEDPIFLRS
jgi:hypothetical protein